MTKHWYTHLSKSLNWQTVFINCDYKDGDPLLEVVEDEWMNTKKTPECICSVRTKYGFQSVVFPQRQQVVLTQQWAKANPVIHFSVMHPGWVDTPGNDSLPPTQRAWQLLLLLVLHVSLTENLNRSALTHTHSCAGQPRPSHTVTGPDGGAIATV